MPAVTRLAVFFTDPNTPPTLRQGREGASVEETYPPYKYSLFFSFYFPSSKGKRTVVVSYDTPNTSRVALTVQYEWSFSFTKNATKLRVWYGGSKRECKFVEGLLLVHAGLRTRLLS